MGFWRDVFLGTPSVAPSLSSPWAPQDSLQSAIVGELLQIPGGLLTRDTALRIPALKRAHDITCGVLSRMPWVLYDNAQPVADQPSWLSTTATGISPRHLRFAVVSDMFMSGSAVLGFELGDDGYPIDALHIPFGWWSVNATTGDIEVDDRIQPRFKQRLIWINLGYGSNGVLNDGYDTLTDARMIQAAYRDRISNPIAQTTLTLAQAMWDGWTRAEREEFRKGWIAGRQAENGATAMKPDSVSVDYAGAIPTDLFESGRNGNRLDIANVAGIPADMLEGSKQGGGGSSIHYSTEVGGAGRNELWDFGLAKYADAIDARLSLDDVCKPGLSIRTDASAYLTAPNPTAPQTSED